MFENLSRVSAAFAVITAAVVIAGCGSSGNSGNSASGTATSGKANLPLTAIGLALGGNARTGMEDTLTLRRGVRVESNVQLVDRLVAVARSLEREPATVEETERLLSLPAGAVVHSIGE